MKIEWKERLEKVENKSKFCVRNQHAYLFCFYVHCLDMVRQSLTHQQITSVEIEKAVSYAQLKFTLSSRTFFVNRVVCMIFVFYSWPFIYLSPPWIRFDCEFGKKHYICRNVAMMCNLKSILCWLICT